jgi:hypothetical protein
MPTGKFRQNKKKGLQSINDAVVKALAKFINSKKACYYRLPQLLSSLRQNFSTQHHEQNAAF